jgi:hypothetical protein
VGGVQDGGIEAVPFGLLILVVGALLITNAPSARVVQVDYVFARAIPGASDGMTVTASATAVAVPG